MNQPNKSQNPDSLHVGETLEQKKNDAFAKLKQMYEAGQILFEEALDAAYFDRSSKSKWIDVKDRLPEHKIQVWLYVDGESIKAYYYRNVKEWYENSRGYERRVLGNITHWQPLPSAPNETNVSPRLYTHEQVLAFGEKVKQKTAQHVRLGFPSEKTAKSILSIDLNKIEIK